VNQPRARMSRGDDSTAPMNGAALESRRNLSAFELAFYVGDRDVEIDRSSVGAGVDCG
jgi:hypothetical protein